MALFMIERNFATALNASAADLKAIVEINNQTVSNGCSRSCPPISEKHIASTKQKAGMPSGRLPDVPVFRRMLSSSLRVSCVQRRWLRHDATLGGGCCAGRA